MPPGWYPDPWWTGSIRYWNGSTWTTEARWAVAFDPPAPPLETLRRPAFGVALVAVFAVVAVSRLLNGATAQWVTTLSRYEISEWVFYVVVYGGLSLVVWGVWRRYRTAPFRRNLGVSFRWSDLGWGPLLFIVARMVQIGVTLPLIFIPALRRSTSRYSDLMRSQPIGLLVTLFFVGVFVAPVVEELVFRGVFLRSLLTRVKAPVAAIIQGILFGCYHFAPVLGLYNIVLITANGAFGVVFGFVALKRRSLGTGMIAHSLTNASVFLIILASR